jgi:hypothetical protein
MIRAPLDRPGSRKAYLRAGAAEANGFSARTAYRTAVPIPRLARDLPTWLADSTPPFAAVDVADSSALNKLQHMSGKTCLGAVQMAHLSGRRTNTS